MKEKMKKKIIIKKIKQKILRKVIVKKKIK